jgi:hypothetical protein
MAEEQTRFEPTFDGKEHIVSYSVWRETRQGYSRGDHYFEGGEYDYHIWRGWVTVRSKATGELQAVCGCGVSRERAFRMTSEGVHDTIVPATLLPDMREAYADFLGKRFLDFFKADRGKGVPYFELQVPSQQELLEAGLILDAEGQRMLALKQ